MITKTEFEEAYRKFPPYGCELFFITHISIHSIKHSKWIFLLPIFLFIPFISEVVIYTLNLDIMWKMIPTYIYIFILAYFGLFWAVIYNKKRKRLEKIRRYLHISKEEYKELIDMYYYNRYSSTKKYVQYNSK